MSFKFGGLDEGDGKKLVVKRAQMEAIASRLTCRFCCRFYFFVIIVTDAAIVATDIIVAIVQIETSLLLPGGLLAAAVGVKWSQTRSPG